MSTIHLYPVILTQLFAMLSFCIKFVFSIFRNINIFFSIGFIFTFFPGQAFEKVNNIYLEVQLLAKSYIIQAVAVLTSLRCAVVCRKFVAP